MVTARSDAVPSLRERRAHAAIVVACFGAFLAFLDATVVNTAFPSIQADFRAAGVTELSWVLNSYNVVFAGLMVAAGRFADLFGRRRVFSLGLVIFTVASGVCAAAGSVQMLIALRALQGIGAALLVPASVGIVLDAAAPGRRAHAVGLWAAAGAVAAALGPVIGGAVVDAYNWRLAFLVNIPLGVAAWFLLRRTVIESRAPGRRRMPDLRGTAALSVGLAAVTWGIIEGGSSRWRNWSMVAGFAVALIAAAVLVWSSRRHPVPIVDRELVRMRSFSIGNLVVVLCGVGLYTYLLTHILWLHYIWGYSLLLAGASVVPGAVVAAALARPFGRLADRYGIRAVAVPGGLVWAGALVWYVVVVGATPHFLTQWLPGQILSGIGVAATLPIATAGSMIAVPFARYGTASAVSSSARQLGGVLGIAILAVFIATPARDALISGLRHGWLMAAVSFGAAAVVAMFFGRTPESAAGGLADVRAPRVTAAPEPELVAAAPTAAPDLLGGLPAPIRERLLGAGRAFLLRAGQMLFAAGDVGDSLFFVRAGRLEVQLPDGHPREIPAGSSVGELALLTQETRSATVVAKRDSELIEVTRDRFEQVAADEPDLMRAVATSLAVLLRASRPIRPPSAGGPSVISIVALDAAVPLDEVSDVIEAGLRRYVTLTRLDRPTVDELMAAELRTDRVLLVARVGEPGAEAALRQADRVVIVTTRGDAPSLPATPVGADVVALGPRPSGATVARWHDLGARRVYPVTGDRAGWADELGPLVRRLAGRSVGVVLAGGGARAFAHLGVIAAFEQAGFPVDRVAGASMGAFIAALWATGANAASIEAAVFEDLVAQHPYGDYTFPRTALARGKRGWGMVRRRFGDLVIEELPRGLVVATTDLVAREPVYHGRGSLAQAVAASISLPVLLPPRRLNGGIHVDGSLTDNCPVAPLVAENDGPVIAIAVSAGGSGTRGGQAAPPRMPSLGEILVRVMLMGGTRGDVPALTITPDTRGIGLLEFHQIDAARDAGLRAGEAALAALADVPGAVPVRPPRSIDGAVMAPIS